MTDVCIFGLFLGGRFQGCVVVTCITSGSAVFFSDINVDVKPPITFDNFSHCQNLFRAQLSTALDELHWWWRSGFEMGPHQPTPSTTNGSAMWVFLPNPPRMLLYHFIRRTIRASVAAAAAAAADAKQIASLWRIVLEAAHKEQHLLSATRGQNISGPSWYCRYRSHSFAQVELTPAHV